MLDTTLLTTTAATVRTRALSNMIGSGGANSPLVKAMVQMGRLPGIDAAAKLSNAFALRRLPSGNGFAVVISCVSCGAERVIVSITGGSGISVPVSRSLGRLNRIIIANRHRCHDSHDTVRAIGGTNGILGIVDRRDVRLSPSIGITDILRHMSNMAVRHSTSNRTSCTVLQNVSGHCGCALIGNIGVPDPSSGGHCVPLGVFPSSLVSHLIISGSLATSVRNSTTNNIISVIVGSTPSRFRVRTGTTVKTDSCF